MTEIKYDLYMICNASQIVTLDHKQNTLEYHEIDEINDNQHLQIFDVTNNRPVGQIDYTEDDEAMYTLACIAIKEYEECLRKEQEEQEGISLQQ